jgi:hypothetical protein
MTIETFRDMDQGSEEWLQARNGIITASEMNLILTPTLKASNNEKTRAHVWEIAAQRINGYTEPSFIGSNGYRGHSDEVIARQLYSERVEPLEEVGFYTRDFGAFKIGYSPDGVTVLSNGGIEAKSRLMKFQTEVIVTNEVPTDHKLQIQTGLLVTEWDWMDYVSFCGGMPMWVIRVFPDPVYQAAIIDAATDFEAKVQEQVLAYQDRIAGAVLIETERQSHDVDMVIT